MVKPRWGDVLRRVHSLFDEGVLPALSDRELLERYATSGPEASEPAFAALVDRHGPMVLRVCRHVLRDEHAAQDAFQATFLVLARKAAGLWEHDSLAPWLHGVAYRTSACARGAAARRRRHERRAAELAPREADDAGADDLGPILHQEIDRLPERYRAPIILCYFEGLTHDQAAESLRCPVGTVRSRLATGRERLRRRLTTRGLAPEHTLTEPATPAIVLPAALAGAAIRNAIVQAGTSTAGTVPATVAALAEEGMRMMGFARFRTIALALMLLGGTAVGVFAFAQGQKEPAQPDLPKPQAVAGVPSPVPVRSFLEARIETAREIINRELDLFSFAPTESNMGDRIPAWSRRLMEDRLRLADTPGARLDAIREHRNRMISLERQIRRFTEAETPIQPAEAFKVKYYRLEADQLLAEAGNDPAKEPPVAEPKANPAPPPPAPPPPTPPVPR